MLKLLAGNGDDEPEIPFVTRLPRNYSLENELRNKAYENSKGWEEAGSFSGREGASKYRIQSFQGELYGKQYRFIVCSSDELDKRKENKLVREMEKELEEIKPVIKKLKKRDFYCEKDALEEINQVKKNLGLSYHELTFKVYEEEKVLKRLSKGRPRKDEYRQTEKVYRLDVKVHEDDVKIKEYRDKEGMFVLVTSVPKEQMNDMEILREYKEQISVEACFRVLKDPYFIDELFVKIPERLEALAYVMLISLMVLNLLERNVRTSLKEDGGIIRIAGNIKTDRPTGNAIVEALDHISVVLVYQPEIGDWQRNCNIDANSRRILHLAGFNEDIYTQENMAV
jgi:transposase